ncbi:MAG: FAD:protein FMN transferase, partial [Clostridiales bacterium]|nr:FAD:protein FMN transferase [Clostridiales bacterium]
SVITSGDYERYMVEIYEKTGERYHHIFDPSTGYPAKSGVISVTVVSESGIEADAWTTSLFVMGVEEGLKLINELDSIDAMFITEDKKIYFSKGFKDQVSDIHRDYHAE